MSPKPKLKRRHCTHLNFNIEETIRLQKGVKTAHINPCDPGDKFVDRPREFRDFFVVGEAICIREYFDIREVSPPGQTPPTVTIYYPSDDQLAICQVRPAAWAQAVEVMKKPARSMLFSPFKMHRDFCRNFILITNIREKNLHSLTMVDMRQLGIWGELNQPGWAGIDNQERLEHCRQILIPEWGERYKRFGFRYKDNPRCQIIEFRVASREEYQRDDAARHERFSKSKKGQVDGLQS